MIYTDEKPKGWFLATPYIKGDGLRVREPKCVPADKRPRQFIFCDDVLLQADDPAALVNDWLSALTPDGCLALWLTDVRFKEPPKGCKRVTIHDVLSWPSVKSGLHTVRMLTTLGVAVGDRPKESGQFSVVEADVIDGHAFIVIRHEHFAVERPKLPWRKQPKHMLLMRTGAHGDALMASSVLPYLKEEGWRVTLLTRLPGYEALKFDPHIDEFLVLPPVSLADDELQAFTEAWFPRFDAVINLNQTIEDRFLKRHTRGDFFWPDAQRRRLCADSYLDFTHFAAGVPRKADSAGFSGYQVKFYPSPEEKEWAEAKKKELGRFVLWCLQGGAVHKWWPYAPQAISRLMARTDYQFVLCGDQNAGDLAAEVTECVDNLFGDTSRLKSLVAVKSIRDAMALAQVADLVIGPETGVMNAVCLEPNAKIVMLSHSAPSNLTDDWVNTAALLPQSDCFPCHRMHYSFDHCPQDEKTGAAACAASISIDRMVEAVLAANTQAPLREETAAA